MDTFGEKLRYEREQLGLSLQSVAETLGVDRDRLIALELNDFESLPDDETVVATLEAYAKCLEVDAELMIEDYRRERDRCLQQLGDFLVERTASGRPSAMPSIAADGKRLTRWLALSAVLGIVLVLGSWWMFSGDGTGTAPAATDVPETPATADIPETPAPQTAAEAQPKPSSDPAEIAPAPAERRVERSTVATSAASHMQISEFAVGTGVENRQLVGERTQFAEGSKAWFWTRVEGGSSGDSIEHVWLREGVEQLRVPLKIGGPRWRTHSNKTLHPGSTGNWSVEARDAAGRLLARREFDCTP